jgi:carbonic anhydrase/acetyltransferase-like protein (isoleucine patch superfamily)
MQLALDHAAPAIAPTAFIAPTAVIVGDVRLGDHASVWYTAVLRGDVQPITVGARTNIQDGAIVHATVGRTPTTIGDDCTIGHRAIVHGCTVGDRVLIGMGAIVLDDAIIGDDSLVGAGALVTSGTVIPPRSLVVGSPAKVRRSLSDDEVTGLRASAAHYVETAAAHRAAVERGPHG